MKYQANCWKNNNKKIQFQLLTFQDDMIQSTIVA